MPSRHGRVRGRCRLGTLALSECGNAVGSGIAQPCGECLEAFGFGHELGVYDWIGAAVLGRAALKCGMFVEQLGIGGGQACGHGEVHPHVAALVCPEPGRPAGVMCSARPKRAPAHRGVWGDTTNAPTQNRRTSGFNRLRALPQTDAATAALGPTHERIRSAADQRSNRRNSVPNRLRALPQTDAATAALVAEYHQRNRRS